MEINIQDIAYMQARATKAAEKRAKSGNNTIVLFEVGNKYEAYNESAEALHDICNHRLFFMGRMSSTHFRKECFDLIAPKMIREGYMFCIYEKEQY